MVKHMIGAIICLLFLNPIKAQDPDLYFRDQQLKKQSNEPVKVTWPIDSTTNEITFRSVVQVENTSAQTLYSRAKTFVSKSFVSGKDATQLVDDVAKNIVGNGIITVGFSDVLAPATGDVKFTFQIECKDNRYRYTFKIGDVRRTFPSGGATNWSNFLSPKKPSWVVKVAWERMQSDAYKNIMLFINSLNKEMLLNSDDF